MRLCRRISPLQMGCMPKGNLNMDWKKWSGKAANYAADGAAEKTVEFALTKVGPYRVAGIIAKLLMAGAVLVAVGAWLLHTYAGWVGTATAIYIIAAIVFAVGLIINWLKSFLFNKAKAAVKTGVGWAAGEVKKRYIDDPNAAKTAASAAGGSGPGTVGGGDPKK